MATQTTVTKPSGLKYTFTSNPNNGQKPSSLSGLVQNFKKNFLERNVEIVPGLTFNQYEIVKRVYFYQHNQFESGPTDENGDPKYFYDLITHRNDQATKSIDLDTKDVYIQAETGGAYMKSWLLRREYIGYSKTSGWGKKLNELAEDLPDFGTVVWKRYKNSDGRICVDEVDLINLMNDPTVDCLDDGMVIERHQLTQDDLITKMGKPWDKDAVVRLINSGKTSAKKAFLDNSPAPQTGMLQNNVDETTPFYDTYEIWGEIPYDLYMKYKTTGKDAEKTDEATIVDPMKKDENGVNQLNKSVYVTAIVAGCGQGETEAVLYCNEADPETEFPYKEVHFRRRKGRWLGVGNYEQCFPLTEKANELTNRFYGSLRIALLHLYQTRDNLHVKNVLTDLLDGDLIVSKSEITQIPTEVRGFTQYKEEMDRIEMQADRACNSYEVVTGADLPSGTPAKLGAQQLGSATKLFDHIQEDMGLFIEDVFNEWLLPDFAAALSKEHILELLDDADDIAIYSLAKTKIYQYEVMKRYILETSQFPEQGQLELVGSLVKDQVAKGPKQVQVEKDYYANLKYSIKVVVTGENDAKKMHLETLNTTLQTLIANPAAVQDPRIMKILGLVLEQTGYSPLEINAVNEAPTNPSLNPANQGGGGADKAATLPGGGAPTMTNSMVPGKTPVPTGA